MSGEYWYGGGRVVKYEGREKGEGVGDSPESSLQVSEE